MNSTVNPESQLPSKEPPQKPTANRSNKNNRNTVFISLVTALLTSLIAPSLLETLRERNAAQERLREKEQRILATQFDIVEKYNSVFWKYRQAAGFLMFDFTHGQADGALLRKHLREFEEASAEANRELPMEAFRARMYFRNEEVYDRLRGTFEKIFYGVDDHISRQLLVDRSVPHPKLPESISNWTQIAGDLDHVKVEAEETLNEVFRKIGTSEAQEDRSVVSSPK
jgi:hypothetical protein